MKIIETAMLFFFAWRDPYDCLPSLVFVDTVITIGVSLKNRKQCIIPCEECEFFERAKLLSFLYFLS